MVYLLKFGVSWIMPPGILILALLALARYAWKRRGERRIAGILAGLAVALYFLSAAFVSERTMGWLESAYEPPRDPAGDVIIMLGGGAMADTRDVDGEGTLCASPANRLLTAVRLQRELGVPILLSGGQVYEDTGAEAKIARRILLSLGVPDDMIFTETKSINTTQNARFSAEIMREQGFHHAILVTSAFHMKRAVLNFEKQGVEVTPYPTDFAVPQDPVFHYTKLRPLAGALAGNVTVLQETLRTFVTKYLE